MKIRPQEFITIYLAIMGENEIECIKIPDLIEVIKILYNSKDFKELVDKLELESFCDDDFYNHPYTKKLDDDGFLFFDISDDEIEEVFKRYDRESELLTQAINKLSAAKYVDMRSNGKIKMAYDDPSGDYSLQIITEPFNNCESKIFTDGNIQNIGLKQGDELYNFFREVKVSDATFSIIVDYRNDIPLGAEIRAGTSADYLMVNQEARQLLKGLNFSYDEVVNEQPKVYKYKLN